MNQEMTKEATHEPSRMEANGADETKPVFQPDADIYETARDVVVLLDLPGVEPINVDVLVERNLLQVVGRVTPHSHEGYRQVHSEYRVGDFARAFTLSEGVDDEHIEATHKDGTLTIPLPKAASARSRKIDVKAG